MRSLVNTKIFLSCFLLVFFSNHAVLASEVSVLSTVAVLNVADEQAEGYLTTQVVNAGSSSMHNVNLRLAAGANNFRLDKELLQFGHLDSGESRAITTRFYAPQSMLESEMLISWQVDYDESNGTHHIQDLVSEVLP